MFLLPRLGRECFKIANPHIQSSFFCHIFLIIKQVANEQRIKRLSVIQVAQMNHNSLVKDYRNTFLMITELCAAEQQI